MTGGCRRLPPPHRRSRAASRGLSGRCCGIWLRWMPMSLSRWSLSCDKAATVRLISRRRRCKAATLATASAHARQARAQDQPARGVTQFRAGRTFQRDRCMQHDVLPALLQVPEIRKSPARQRGSLSSPARRAAMSLGAEAQPCEPGIVHGRQRARTRRLARSSRAARSRCSRARSGFRFDRGRQNARRRNGECAHDRLHCAQSRPLTGLGDRREMGGL